MTVDKRSVHTDALETLGAIIGANEARDAIHLAVEPIEAMEKLMPGEDVGIVDGKASKWAAKRVGIVDPFLKGMVEKGERFWLVVYPRQITSLRHVWTHPDFEAVADISEASNDAKSVSEAWMKEWAVQHMSEDYYGDYDKPLPPETAYAYAIDAGHNLSVGPYEDARVHINQEWWTHWERITGQVGQRDEYFSCAC